MVDIRTIIDDTLSIITGKIQDTRLIKVHRDNLQTVGELSFPKNISAWKSLLDADNIFLNKSKSILEYYLQRLGKVTSSLSEKEIDHQALELLKLASSNKTWRIVKTLLINDRICLFLDRSLLISSTIKQVINEGKLFGQSPAKDRTISIKINQDPDSNLTTTRLQVLQNFSQNILKLQGYKISDDNPDIQVLLTTKSEGKIEDDTKKIVCGVVKNHETDSKEVLLNFERYLEQKFDEVKEVDDGRLPGTEGQDDLRLMRIAKAIVIFELLRLRTSRPIVIGGNKDKQSVKSTIKTGTFVLYNASRIEAILRTFKDGQLTGLYNDVSNIHDVDFSKIQSEEEWSLIWNFVLGYKETLSSSVLYKNQNIELCPQQFISFLSNWSSQFSVYYHRTRILTGGNKNLAPTVLARIQLLKAFLIIVNNALETMTLLSISSM